MQLARYVGADSSSRETRRLLLLVVVVVVVVVIITIIIVVGFDVYTSIGGCVLIIMKTSAH